MKMVQKIEIRCSPFEKNRIKFLADKFAGGNVSLYMIYAALNVTKKKIEIKDVERYSKRRKGHDKSIV